MASGNFQSNTGVNCNIRVEWSSTTNVADNTSSVRVKVYLVHNSLYNVSKTLTINCLGQSYSVATPVINTTASGNKTLLADKSFTVQHNSDGTKSGTISATINSFNVTYSGTYIGNLSTSGTATLDNIPRSTQPTLSASTVEMGKTITINCPRASGSFKHKLWYLMGNTGWVVIAENVGTSYTWTVPLSLANQIPSSTSGTVTIAVETFNGSTLIGEKRTTFTATVPSSVVPSISSITCTDPTGNLTKYQAYVQGKSTCKVTATAAGSYSSTITSYKIEVNGSTYTSNGITTGILNTVGSNTIKVTVTDSRGRTATKTTTITVIAYTSPTIVTLTAYRCLSDGTLDEDGAYIKITFATSITSLNNANKRNLTLSSKKSTDTYYTTLETHQAYSANRTVVISKIGSVNIDIDSSYDIQITAQDDFSTASKTVQVGTSFTLIDFRSTGKGVSFGKVSEIDGFDCGLPARFRNTVDFDKPIKYKKIGNTTISGSVDVSGYEEGTKLHIEVTLKISSSTSGTFSFDIIKNNGDYIYGHGYHYDSNYYGSVYIKESGQKISVDTSWTKIVSGGSALSLSGTIYVYVA